jgi:hypothetical protein
MVQEPKVRTVMNEKSLKKIGIAAGLLIVAFLLGYVPAAISSRTTSQQRAEMERRLKVAELGSQLAMASYEAGRNNYANATQFSGKFFDGLPEIISQTSDQGLKSKLQALLGRRDEITANLAQVDQSVKEKLAQLYADYFQATQAVNASRQ